MPSFETIKEKPKENEVPTFDLDNLEADIEEMFGKELDDVEFDDVVEDVDTKAKENEFLGSIDPKARKAIDNAAFTDVEFEGINDRIADKIKGIVRKKIDQNHVMAGLSGDALIEAENVRNRLFTEAKIATLSEDQVEDAADVLYERIKSAIEEVEVKYAQTH